MAYAAIADSEIDPESPGTTTLFTKLRNNPIEMFAKASGAPVLANDYVVTAMIGDGEVTPAKLSDYTSGDYVEDYALLSGPQMGLFGTSYAKELEIKVPRGGTIKTRLGGTESANDLNIRLKIYVNGAAVGTERIPVSATGSEWLWWNEDISVNAGDLVQVYARETGGAGYGHICLAIMCDNPTKASPAYTSMHVLTKTDNFLYDET